VAEQGRAEWISELERETGIEVPVAEGKIGEDVEYLFWVGCAGALEDRAKKTTKAVAQLLHTAGQARTGARLPRAASATPSPHYRPEEFGEKCELFGGGLAVIACPL
jgi:Fe-S oxidoreductase